MPEQEQTNITLLRWNEYANWMPLRQALTRAPAGQIAERNIADQSGSQLEGSTSGANKTRNYAKKQEGWLRFNSNFSSLCSRKLHSGNTPDGDQGEGAKFEDLKPKGWPRVPAPKGISVRSAKPAPSRASGRFNSLRTKIKQDEFSIAELTKRPKSDSGSDSSAPGAACRQALSWSSN